MGVTTDPLEPTAAEIPVEESLLTVCLCGGGNAAHTSAAWLGQKSKNIAVNVLTRQPEKWKRQITLHTRCARWAHLGKVLGDVKKVSSDPAEVIPGADVCIICAPAYAHTPLLLQIREHLKKGAIVGTVFGQGGFDWAVTHAFKGHAAAREKLGGYFALQNLPWLCRLVSYGASADLIGAKAYINVAVAPAAVAPLVRLLIGMLFDIPCNLLPNFLSITLSPSNQIIHPARVYSIFSSWDGKTPLTEDEVQWGLYSDFDACAAEWLEKLSGELQQIRLALESRFPGLNLSAVLPIQERVIKHYGSDVQDTSSLQSVFRSHRGYASIRTPVVAVPGGYMPDVSGRLLCEDIPFGLCVLKDLAEQLQLSTPSMDFLIEWHQKLMNKEYIRRGKLNPDAIAETSCARAFGFTCLEQVVSLSLQAQDNTCFAAVAAPCGVGHNKQGRKEKQQPQQQQQQ